MVIYTPHRGTLADAMKEAKEFENNVNIRYID